MADKTASHDGQMMDFRAGTVAIMGRPNVGKSTLLNALVEFRLSIISPRPQTTRHRIMGVYTNAHGQIAFLDTPGMHRQAKQALNRQLNRTAHASLEGADVALQVVEAGRFDDEDDMVYKAIKEHDVVHLLVINKIDLYPDKGRLLPFTTQLSSAHTFDEIFYASSLKNRGVADLQDRVIAHLPLGEALFAEDEITDRSERFLAAEMIREQLMRQLQQELPYANTVIIESFKRREDEVLEIHAIVWVERKGQKAIVIGKAGSKLKQISTRARLIMERTFEQKVYLRIWVKVREGWVDDEIAIKRFGYTD